MYICKYVHMYIYTYIRIYISMHTHLHIQTYTYMYIYMCTHAYIYCTHIHIHTHIYTYIYICIYIYTYKYIHTYMRPHILRGPPSSRPLARPGPQRRCVPRNKDFMKELGHCVFLKCSVLSCWCTIGSNSLTDETGKACQNHEDLPLCPTLSRCPGLPRLPSRSRSRR